mgnify:CR=1 FL=1
MMQKEFQHTLDWAVSNGLILNNNVERKCVDGIWGMYASKNLDKDELLGSFPTTNLINPNQLDYPKEASNSARQIHTSATEYAAPSSHYSPLFLCHDDTETLKLFSTYFSNEKELNALKEISTGLFNEIIKQNHLNKTLINALYRFDSSIDIDTYTAVTLNYNSRAMGSQGFVPILDCFNHSDEKGMSIDSGGDTVILKTKVSYKKGEQVFVSYGTLDIYSHAINYNYFDPNNQHFIQFGKRFNFPVLGKADLDFANQLKKSHNVNLHKYNGMVTYSIDDRAAFLSEQGPSKRLIGIVKTLCAKENNKSHINESDNQQVKQKLLNLLSQLDNQNNVDKFGSKYMPRRIRYLYHMLQKEKQMIALNKQWVEENL